MTHKGPFRRSYGNNDKKLLDRKRACLPTLEETSNAEETSPTAVPAPPAASMSQKGDGQETSTTQAEALRQMRRGKRYERYQTVVALHQQGLGARTIARQVGLSRNTVRSYVAAETFPEQGLRNKRWSLLDPYLPYLRERWNAGCQNVAVKRDYHGILTEESVYKEGAEHAGDQLEVLSFSGSEPDHTRLH